MYNSQSTKLFHELIPIYNRHV